MNERMTSGERGGEGEGKGEGEGQADGLAWNNLPVIDRQVLGEEAWRTARIAAATSITIAVPTAALRQRRPDQTRLPPNAGEAACMHH